MLKFAALACLFSIIPPSLQARQRVQGFCEKGSIPVVAPSTVGGTPSLRYFQQSYPSCTVQVNQTGTGIFVLIYSDNMGTPLTNPFTADSTGYWGFYVDNGTYDIRISGGGLSAPFTFGAVQAFDIAGYTPPSVSFSQITPGANGGALAMATGGSFSTQAGASIDFGTGSHTRPWLTGMNASKPATCTVGEAYFATDSTAGENVYLCSSTNTWTQVTGGGGGGPFLPLSGGTMTGNITTSANIGAIYVTYPGNIESQVSPTSGQSSTCVMGNCPDATLIDYFGFEGNFFRIKGGGDYFDWTRWGPSTSALPVHTINFNDSSFNTIIHVDETASYPNTRTQFNGGIDLGYCNDPATPSTCSGLSPDVGIYRNTTNVLEVTKGGPSGGTPANLARTLGDSFVSYATGTNIGYQSNGGKAQILGNGTIGGVTVNVADDMVLTNGGTYQISGHPIFRYNGTSPSGNVQFSDDAGGSWTNIATVATAQWNYSAGPPAILYPLSSSTHVLVGTNTDDASGSALQVTGAVRATGGITSLSTITGTPVNTTTTYKIGSNDVFRYNGTYGSGNVQFNDGTGWVNLAATTNYWTLSSSLLYPNMTSYQVLIGRTTDDGSNAPLEIVGKVCGGTKCSINAGGAIQSVATGTDLAFQANGGTFQVLGNGTTGAANFNVGTSGTIQWNSVPYLQVSAGNLQWWNGSMWVNFASGGSSWTLTGNLLYPTSTSYKVLVGRSTDDGSSAAFQVAGSINASGTIQSTQAGTNVALQVNSGTFQVLGNGLAGAANFNLGAGGTYQFNGQNGFRCVGGPPCTLQWFDGVSTWNSFTTSTPWTLSGNLLYPTSTTNKVLIGRTTDDGSGARLQIGSINDATGSINAGGLIQSYVTGTNIGLQVNSGLFSVNGNGAVSAAGPLNVANGGSVIGTVGTSTVTLRVHGTVVGGTWDTGLSTAGPPIIATGTSAAVAWTARTISSYSGTTGQLWEWYATDATRTALWSPNGDAIQVNALVGSTAPYGTINLTQGWLLFGGTGPNVNTAAGIRVSGGVLQWSNGSNIWNNFSTGASAVTSVSGTGAGISISPITGNVVVQNTGVTSLTGTASQVTVSANTGAITVSLPSSLSIAGQYASSATGSSVAFTGTSFQILGNGNFNTSGVWNGGSLILAASSTISQNGVGTLSDSTGTWVQNVHIPVSGSIYVRAFASSTAASCSGVADGWFGVTGDGYVVACYGSTRYRAALTAY